MKMCDIFVYFISGAQAKGQKPRNFGSYGKLPAISKINLGLFYRYKRKYLFGLRIQTSIIIEQRQNKK